MTVLSVEDLEVRYAVEDGSVYAVQGVSFDIGSQEIVGLLGESGSGKSTVAEAIVRALPTNASVPAGSIHLGDEDVLEMSNRRLREIRWDDIAMIPQAAMGSLDPVYTIRDQLYETVFAHTSMSKPDVKARAEEVLRTVDINSSRLNDYPHQLSGGMRQRILLAMSLLLKPELIIADEPTTGLDVLTRDKILGDIERYRDEFDVSVLFISHDIADMVETCDDLITMYGGKIVEVGEAEELFTLPSHPYTIGLKNSVPHIERDSNELISMEMDPPENRSALEECVFADRCPYAVEECYDSHPPLVSTPSGTSACYRTGEADTLREQATQVRWSK